MKTGTDGWPYLQGFDPKRALPQPADLLAAAFRERPAPRAAEAWGLALASLDERCTLHLTPEILAARDLAVPLLAIGDPVGARLAFSAAYGRLLRQQQTRGRAVHWFRSPGWDSARREQEDRPVCTSSQMTDAMRIRSRLAELRAVIDQASPRTRR